MSAALRDATSLLRHVTPGCVLCGAELCRASTGRRRLYCGGACRQRAYRLRDEASRWRGARGHEADPREVASLLATVLHASTRR
jgi:hypothetical protein